MKKNFLYKLRRKFQILFFDIFSKEFVSKTYYRIVLHEKLNLKSPESFNEKIQWLKLYEWPYNDLAILCTDKYRVREYLNNNDCSKYLCKLIGVYDKPEEIDWDKLPNKFVLKCNHGCAYNIICTNKANLNEKRVKKQLSVWLEEDFGKFNAEMHYSKIDRKIICEEYLGDNLEDFKFFCFNGKCKFLYTAIDSDCKDRLEREAFFDPDGKLMDVSNSDYGFYKEAKLPKNFKDIIAISEKLAKPFPFVRVDWYVKNDKLTFGELTFTPSGGLMKLKPKSFDLDIGKFFEINNIRNK